MYLVTPVAEPPLQSRFWPALSRRYPGKVTQACLSSPAWRALRYRASCLEKAEDHESLQTKPDGPIFSGVPVNVSY